MFENQIINDVINTFFVAGSFVGFGYIIYVAKKAWNEDLHTDNDIRNDLRNDKTEGQVKDYLKAQKKALKAATKRAKA